MMEDTLSAYTHRIAETPPDPALVHLIKRNIIDSYAGICASLQDTPLLQKFDRLASMVPSEKGMMVWGVGRRSQVTEALFMNTILARRSDLVNTYLSPGNRGGAHPSDNVSLVLALADWKDKSGTEVLRSTLLAYELSCMFAAYYNPEQNNYDHDAQALFFTPLVIGSMMGLGVDELTQAQRIAGMMGLTINQAAVGQVTDWKHCTYASCALRGYEAVMLAASGFIGPVDIFDGESGISQFIPHGLSIMDPRPDLQSVIFKQWPALVFCQAPIDAAIEIAQKIEDPVAIDCVRVYIYRKAIEEAAIPSSYHPASRAARTHSLPYCIAAALIKKTIEYGFFDDGFLEHNETIAALIPKIAIIEDPVMTRTYPDGAPCRIIVIFNDGSSIESSRKFPHGDPQDPLSDQEITDKACRNLSLLIPPDEAEAVIARIWNLENERSVDWLVAPLKKRMLV